MANEGATDHLRAKLNKSPNNRQIRSKLQSAKSQLTCAPAILLSGVKNASQLHDNRSFISINLTYHCERRFQKEFKLSDRVRSTKKH